SARLGTTAAVRFQLGVSAPNLPRSTMDSVIIAGIDVPVRSGRPNRWRLTNPLQPSAHALPSAAHSRPALSPSKARCASAQPPPPSSLPNRQLPRRIYDCEDNPFLADFYAEKPGSAFRAQMYFLLERQKRLREALAIEAPGPVLSDYLIEKDRIFANLNLDDEELKLYDRYYTNFTADIPAPDLVVYLQANPEVLRARIAKKALRDESHISAEYIEEVARAYEHFFFHYAASDLLVINTSEIDFVERSEDLQHLLRRLQDPVK